MEPAYTTVQPENLYSTANGWALDYNPGASEEAVVRHVGRYFSRPVQGLGAYPGQSTMHVDRPVPGPRADQPVHGFRPSYEAVHPGFGAFGAVDIRPYVTFYTQAGAVPVVIDPTSVLQGNVVFPVVGNVPYDLDVFGRQMILHVPLYGDVLVPLFGALSGGAGEGGGQSNVNIPGLGDTPYEVTFGPPALPAGSLATTTGLLSVVGGGILPLVLIGGLAFFLLRKR